MESGNSENKPTKQRPHSNCTPEDGGAVSFARVKEDEEHEIRRRRTVFGIEKKVGAGDELMGLAISGGGIRSATFSLGIIQRLAERQWPDGDPHEDGSGLLKHLDYLSTVSGGGYIGSWLLSWIQREETAKIPRKREDRELGGQDRWLTEERGGFAKVEEALRSDHTHESEEITFLRQYSNYLTPRVSLFSADTWVVGSIWARNTLLNLATLVAAFAVAVLVIRGLGRAGLQLARLHWLDWKAEVGWPLFISAGLLVFIVGFIGSNLARNSAIALNPVEPKSREGEADDRRVLRFCLFPVLSAVAYCIWLSKARALFVNGDLWTGIRANFIVTAAAFLFIQIRARVYQCAKAKKEEMQSELRGWDRAAVISSYVFGPLCSAFVTAALLRAVALLFDSRFGAPDKPWFVFTLGPPLVLTAFTLGMIVHIGLMGRDLPEASREWLGRLRGLLTVITLVWIGAAGVALYGPWVVAWLGVNGPKALATLGFGWAASTLAGLFAGNSGKTDGKAPDGGKKPKGKSWLEVVAEIAPYVFMLGFTVMIAFGVHGILVYGLPAKPLNPRAGQIEKYDLKVSNNNVVFLHETHAVRIMGLDWVLGRYWNELSDTQIIASKGRWMLSGLLPLFLLLLIAGALLAWRVDINVFSMFYFYKNRLVRCYLGASRQEKRKPSPFTGFDDFDDSYLCLFTRQANYLGPYPIMNAALNVTSGGKLQYQERQAQSFVFTPRYTGFSAENVVDEMRMMDSATGRLADYQKAAELNKHERALGKKAQALAYRPTAVAGGGVSVGMAMAISGAAANPNMGYHTSLAVSFLLTVFNVRLGWWFGNALKKSFSSQGPGFGLLYSFRELFGMANADSSYVSLSDGGHFDNMGIYELVRRGCRYIICCDGEQDQDLTFNGIGNAIRKCRTDFGVDIDLPTAPLHKAEGFSGAHCVVGKIKYPQRTAKGSSAPDSAREGYILYLKASLTGDEATDVLEYRSRQPAFPHQTTGDQWFDESQFESYRKLGYHVADKALSGVKLDNEDAKGRFHFFESLAQIWYPRSAAVEKNSPAHTEIYSRILDAVRLDKDLGNLDGDLFEGYAAEATGWSHNSGHLCNSFIQLMERVFYDLGLEDRATWEHPYVKGWLAIFDYWVNREAFKKAWAVTKHSYPARFCQFYDSRVRKAAAAP